MSFITKRERVFNEYDLYDMPARNEGKLKAYASCTDARAWSHFCSDKSEHLVEIIKRNNDMCRPKYVPTDVIIDTLMIGKNAEIARLKRRIEQFEQMVAAYDALDLTCDQKCEIAKAHAAIKEANKELNELCLDLDVSGFTEGSDAYETGKSRGDEPSKNFTYEKESKSNQTGNTCPCDVGTMAIDPRIEEMQETIINKDAKLNAMQNTIAVMENDVCEPYCIYAHIYTALEKIFGILCQNHKYKLYLELMTSGRDKRARCMDIKGKILLKLKVLEKFSLALVAPCSQEMASEQNESACYRAELATHIETTFALTSSESVKPCLDKKRAQLVADIMENEEMREILCKDSCSNKNDLEIEDYIVEDYNIETENLKRLKQLQENYDDLMNCYESLKHEKDCLMIRCRKYEEVEKDFESLKCQLREYNALWNEKEHYRKRSIDLDQLKEQFLILSNETSNLETQLKAEAEINDAKTKTIDELRQENLALENKLNDALIVFEKEKNSLQCKIKECECKEMCQDQQIKSLTVQIDRLLEQDPTTTKKDDLSLLDEINVQKEQIKNLKDLLYGSEDEKQQFQDEYQNKLNLINSLKMEIEDWKSTYEKTLQSNKILTDDYRNEIQKLMDMNDNLAQDIGDKESAIEKLISVINRKSQEINNLMETLEQKDEEMRTLKETYKRNLSNLDDQKMEAMSSLQVARQESQELLEKVKKYADKARKEEELANNLQVQSEEFKKLKQMFESTQTENKSLQNELKVSDTNNTYLREEIERLKNLNTEAKNNINCLENENEKYRVSLQLTRRESRLLDEKLQRYEDLSHQLNKLRESHEKLIEQKCRLENELHNKKVALDNASQSIEVSKSQSEELLTRLKESQNMQLEFAALTNAYEKSLREKEALQRNLSDKREELDNIYMSFEELKNRYNHKCIEIENLSKELTSLQTTFQNVLSDKKILQSQYENKTEEFNSLYKSLEIKIEENKDLNNQLQILEMNRNALFNDIDLLRSNAQHDLAAAQKNSEDLMEKIKYYETLESEYDRLKVALDNTVSEKNTLKRELEVKMSELRKLQRENTDLHSQSQNLLSHSEDLENALVNTRKELIAKSSEADNYPQSTIIKEIEEMKREKINSRNLNRELRDRLEESDIFISNLHEDVLARDAKIVVLENHINELQDEVKRLHNSLALAVNTGEEITDTSQRKIYESLQSLDAHHSKATHNMKMELAKLKIQNSKLEEQLSENKIKSEEFDHDKNKYLSQIVEFQNERDIVVTVIKELEMKSAGDSALAPNKCDVEDILTSLDRIRKFLDSNSTKSSSLEHKLQKIQDSVQTKADEAKKLVEKEKQKIICEKEEAIRDRINLEKQLNELKKQLHIQRSQDRKTIKDLESEMQNQKLISDKINRSRDDYISKLEEEMGTLQNSYQNAIGQITDLQNKLVSINEEHNKNIVTIEEVNKQLGEKCKEVEMLRKQLNELKKPPYKDESTQVYPITMNHDTGNQTEKSMEYEHYIRYEMDTKDNLHETRQQSNKHDKNVINKATSKPLNEIQVLTVNVDPNFEYGKSEFSHNVQQMMNTSQTEENSSGPCGRETQYGQVDDKIIQKRILKQDNNKSSATTTIKLDPNKFIDIYNKKLMHTNSVDVENNLNNHTEQNYTEAGFSAHYDSDINNENQSKSDKDLFVIYRDSDSNTGNKQEKRRWSEGRSEVLAESISLRSEIKQGQLNRQQNMASDSMIYKESEEPDEDDSVKQKLHINLPRVEMDAHSDSEMFKSVESYTLYSTTKDYNSYNYKTVETDNITKQGKQFVAIDNLNNYRKQTSNASNEKRAKSQKTSHHSDKINEGPSKQSKSENDPGTTTTTQSPESHYRLSRVEADVFLIKNDEQAPKQKNDNFALDYILDSFLVEGQDDKPYNAVKALRKARSNENFNNIIKIHGRSDSSPSRLSDLKPSENKTFVSGYSPSKTSQTSEPKFYRERSIMAKLDSVEEYEVKIRNLSKTLENIEKDYKKKIEVIKTQYDNNIKSIINEHNQGVRSIQSLHEETLQDIIKMHENEVENWRSMSIEAMRKADILEKENRSLKCKIKDSCATGLDEEPIKITTPELKRRRTSRIDSIMLTKTNVEAFNVKPKIRTHGPCTCSLDVNVSDTIHNIFKQVDVDQRKIAQHAYVKYIANKIFNSNVEALDTQELLFLHFIVCQTWKMKSSKEEQLQKRINSLETELMHKQKNTQQNIAELDRKVAEERRRLQEVREAVCRHTTTTSREPEQEIRYVTATPTSTTHYNNKEYKHSCLCNSPNCKLEICERRSAGDLTQLSGTIRPKRTRVENSRAVLAKLDVDERKEKKLFTDETPTRLRKTYDRQSRLNKK